MGRSWESRLMSEQGKTLVRKVNRAQNVLAVGRWGEVGGRGPHTRDLGVRRAAGLGRVLRMHSVERGGGSTSGLGPIVAD